MKVLHIHAEWQYGGVETFLLTLARGQSLCPEMTPAFAMCFDQRLAKELTEVGYPPSMLGEIRISRPLSAFQAQARLKTVLEQEKPDVAICHMPKTFVFFQKVLRRFHIPTVLYMHVPVDDSFYQQFARRLPHPDLLVGVSDHTLQVARKMISREAPHAVIHYPMPWAAAQFVGDPTERPQLRQEWATPEEATVIVQASRLVPWKGHIRLLEALILLKDEPGWVFWLIGGPQTPEEEGYYQQLKQQASEGGISGRIRWIGQRSDVMRFLAAADIYCQANTGPEGYGLSFVEAFSVAVPVVTTDLGPAREVIENAGFVTPPEDPAAFADAVRTLLRDREQRRQRGEYARQRAFAVWDVRQQIERLKEALTEIGR